MRRDRSNIFCIFEYLGEKIKTQKRLPSRCEKWLTNRGGRKNQNIRRVIQQETYINS